MLSRIYLSVCPTHTRIGMSNVECIELVFGVYAILSLSYTVNHKNVTLILFLTITLVNLN